MRFLLADPVASTRFALCTLLEQQPGWRVVGEVSSAEHILGQIKVCNADVLLLDWNLPGLIREEFIPSLKEDYPTLAIILMSGRPELKKQACSVGADAFVSKTEPPDKLLATITRISTKSG